MLYHAHAFCEYKVTIAPIDRPGDTVAVERFNDSNAERDADRLAKSLEDLENVVVQVSCQQCW